MSHWRPGHPIPDLARWVSSLVLCAGLMPFALIGIVAAFRSRSDGRRLCALFLVAYALLHAGLSAGIRYRSPVMPAFFVMAAAGLGAFAGWRRAGSATAAHEPSGG